jgi:hypothetical protein
MLTKNCTANAENDDFRANLLTRIIDPMVRGMWLRVLPTDDDFDDVTSAMKQDWDNLLPLLIEHNLIKCKVTDGVESYEYVKASWGCFQTMTRDTLDVRTTPVRQPGTPLTWYISLGSAYRLLFLIAGYTIGTRNDSTMPCKWAKALLYFLGTSLASKSSDQRCG